MVLPISLLFEQNLPPFRALPANEIMGWAKTGHESMIEKQRVSGSSHAWQRKDFYEENMDAVTGSFGI